MGNQIGTLYLDKRLTNLSVKFKNAALIGDMVLPIVDVTQETDQYARWKRNDFRVEDALRADGTESKEALMELDTDGTFRCEEYALHIPITDRQRKRAIVPLSIDMNRTETLTNMIKLGHESRVATLVQTAANAGGSVTLSGTEQFNDASFDSDSKTDAIEVRIDAGKESIRQAIGVEPNTVIIPSNVAKVIKRDPEVRALVKPTDSTLLTNGNLPSILWNMRVLEAGAVLDSAERGQSYSGSDVWGKHISLAYIAPSVGIDTFTLGVTFQATGMHANKWREEKKSSDIVEVSHTVDEVIVCSECLYIIRDAIA